MKSLLKFLIIGGLIVAPLAVSAQSSSVWKYVGGLLQPVVATWNVYAPADFRFDGDLLPDGVDCSAGQILKKVGANDWDCATDNSGIDDPFTHPATGVSATTSEIRTGGLITGSSTVSGITADTSTTTNASTTNLRVSSSAVLEYLGTGLLKATSGAVGLATAGVDYVADVTGDWTGTFDGQQGTWYIDRANHTGTQLAATISDFTSSARAIISAVSPITYDSGTGAIGLNAGAITTLPGVTSIGSAGATTTVQGPLDVLQGLAAHIYVETTGPLVAPVIQATSTTLRSSLQGVDMTYGSSTAFTVTGSGSSFIVSMGNAGVGTSTPQTDLVLGNRIAFESTSYGSSLPSGATIGGVNVLHGYLDTGPFIQSYASQPLLLNPGGNKIGIGTTTPNGSLVGIESQSTTEGVVVIKANTANNTVPLRVIAVGASVEGDAVPIGGEVAIFQRNRTSAYGAAIALVGGSGTGSGSIQFGDKDDIDIGRIVYTNSTNNLGFFTNNSEKFTITSAGNVGVGSTSPTYKFSANSTAATSFSVDSNGNVGVKTAPDTTNAALDVNGNLRSARYLLGNDLGLIPVAGGQSVVSSWHGLQLAGNVQNYPYAYSPSNIGAAGSAHVILPMNNNVPSAAGFSIFGTTDTFNGPQTGNYFQISSSTATVAGLLAFTPSGNLGIGTSTPFGKLAVASTTGSTAGAFYIDPTLVVAKIRDVFGNYASYTSGVGMWETNASSSVYSLDREDGSDEVLASYNFRYTDARTNPWIELDYNNDDGGVCPGPTDVTLKAVMTTNSTNTTNATGVIVSQSGSTAAACSFSGTGIGTLYCQFQVGRAGLSFARNAQVFINIVAEDFNDADCRVGLRGFRAYFN